MHAPRARAFTVLLILAGLAPGTAASAASPVPATSRADGTLQVTQAWARPTPPGVTVAAAYFAIRNTGTSADRLLEVATTLASRTEIHETKVNSDGVAMMRRLEALAVPAGATVKLEPGGAHVMIFGVAAPFVETQRVPLRLRFEKAGWMDVEVVVGPVAPGADRSMHRHH